MANLIFILTYSTLTLGNTLLFYASIVYDAKILTYMTLGFASVFIFIGMVGFSKEMAVKMSKKENYSEMVRENLIPIWYRPIVGVISAFIYFYTGYEIFAYLILLSSFGEVVLQYRATNILFKQD